MTLALLLGVSGVGCSGDSAAVSGETGARPSCTEEEAFTVTESVRWPGTDCLLVTFLGNAKRLPGDLTLVDWTSAGAGRGYTAPWRRHTECS